MEFMPNVSMEVRLKSSEISMQQVSFTFLKAHFFFEINEIVGHFVQAHAFHISNVFSKINIDYTALKKKQFCNSIKGGGGRGLICIFAKITSQSVFPAQYPFLNTTVESGIEHCTAPVCITVSMATFTVVPSLH